MRPRVSDDGWKRTVSEIKLTPLSSPSSLDSSEVGPPMSRGKLTGVGGPRLLFVIVKTE